MMEPPAAGIISAARLAISVKEKHEITMVRKVFARGVGIASPKLILVGEPDGVDQEIQLPPFGAQMERSVRCFNSQFIRCFTTDN